MAETVDSRPLGVLVRSKNASYITKFPYNVDDDAPGYRVPESRHSEFSPTGDHFVSIEEEDSIAYIRSAVDGSVIAKCGGLHDPTTPLKINFATFSPRGSFLLTWARPAEGVSVPNLVVYCVSDGSYMGAFHQKVFHLGFWPSIQWSDDESIASRAVTNTIHFFKGDAIGAPPIAKLPIPGVSKFSLSHGPAPYTIAAFIPGVKGAPGRIATFKHPDEGGEQMHSRATFRADSVTFKWNSKGTAVLALISTNIDTTGKSYYGESEVYFMDNLGLVEHRVQLNKEGPTYDAAWSPTGMEFIIIYGFMPASATMFDDKAEAQFTFGTGSRNTISFSPHGRFVALAGFGNLAGMVEFWDKNRKTLVGRAELPCTTQHSWSPCSRYFMGATTFPRLRVDNGYRVVRFDGKVMHEHKMTDTNLYQAEFRPALRLTYADPKLTMDQMIGGPPEMPGANGVEGTSAKKAVYRPPGSRGVASTLKVHQHIEAGKVDKATFLKSAVGSSTAVGRAPNGKKFVPGMDPALVDAGPSKAALARKKKKERLAQTQKEGNKESAAGPEGPIAPEKIETTEEGEKRVKKIRKKLRMITSLKKDQKEGKDLNDEQLKKIATEGELQDEISRVEKRMAQLST